MNIDWTSLRTVDGDASAIPALLDDLTYGERIAGERAYRVLNDLVTEEGELFDAAPGVAAVVTDRLGTGTIKNRAPALWLLAEFSSCGPDRLAQPPTEAMRLKYEVQRIIEDRFDLYRVLLQDPEVEVRHAAILLLSFFELRVGDAEQVLRRAEDIAVSKTDQDKLAAGISRLRATPTPHAFGGTVNVNDPHVQALVRRRERAMRSGKPAAPGGWIQRVRGKLVARIMRSMKAR